MTTKYVEVTASTGQNCTHYYNFPLWVFKCFDQWLKFKNSYFVQSYIEFVKYKTYTYEKTSFQHGSLVVGEYDCIVYGKP